MFLKNYTYSNWTSNKTFDIQHNAQISITVGEKKGSDKI